MQWNGRLTDFIPMIDFLADTFGQNVEFVLHDLSKSGSTIIAIRNGHITGRKVGDSLSDFTLRMLKEQVKTYDDFIKFKDRTMFRENLKSTDLLLKNNDGEIIGLLCVNLNKEQLIDIRSFIDSLIGSSAKPSTKNTKKKDAILLSSETSFRDVAISMVDATIAEFDVEVERMTADEKISITSKLQDKGVFQLKGIVPIVATKLNTSDATIYRYLNSL